MNRLLSLALLTGHTLAATLSLVDEVTSGAVTVETDSSTTTILDGPKLGSTANDTTYDWWYFDAVSASTNASLSIVFYNAGADGFLNPWWAEALSVSVTGTFANGTLFNLVAGSASGADITYDDASISVDYTGAGISFVGSTVDGVLTYVVTLASEEIGVSGTVTYTSVRSSHPPSLHTYTHLLTTPSSPPPTTPAPPPRAAASSSCHTSTGPTPCPTRPPPST